MGLLRPSTTNIDGVLGSLADSSRREGGSSGSNESKRKSSLSMSCMWFMARVFGFELQGTRCDNGYNKWSLGRVMRDRKAEEERGTRRVKHRNN